MAGYKTSGAAAGGPPSGPAGGDLSGTYPNPSVDVSPLLVIAFGGKMNDLGKFAPVGGMTTDADWASAPRTRAPIPVAGSITTIAYQTQAADVTTTLKIHINGVVQATQALASVNASFGGVETVAVAVAAGDYCELELDAGTDPNESIFYLILEAS